jgi:hypothetical protein
MEATVRQAHIALDDWIDKNTQNLSCRKGCFSCCYALIIVGSSEARYLHTQLDSSALARIWQEGPARLEAIRTHKHNPQFATQHFLSKQACSLLQEGICTAHAARPLACRGVLTDLSPAYCAPGAVISLRGPAKTSYQKQLSKQHGPEHYLKKPWQKSKQAAQALWKSEQQSGFNLTGELISFLYLLQQTSFQEALHSAKQTDLYLDNLGLLGGDWGFWVDEQ